MNCIGKQILRKQSGKLGLTLALAISLTGTTWNSAVAEVVITEIMYNPDGSDRDDAAGFNREWVEVFNAGDQPLDIGGWQFADVADSQFASLVPGSYILGPQEAVVLVGDAATFDAQWGPGINRIELDNFPTLSNSPSLGNESVAFYDPATNRFRDEVYYDDQGAWPSDSPDGASIMLRPERLNAFANNSGDSWIPSMWGVYGAEYKVSPQGTQDRASPGFVETVQQVPFAPSADASWSMVVLPDTQNYSKNSNDFPRFQEMTEWIRDNQSQFGIELVIHEGDIVNNNNTNNPSSGNQTGDQQWQNAKAAMSVLDGVVPYVFAPGNHDYGTTNAQDRSTQFNDYFKASDNPLVDPSQGGILKQIETADKLDNALYEFTAPDGREMVVLALEWGPRQSAVNLADDWMSRPQYADHTAVMVTHAYMWHDETRYDWSRNQDSNPNNNQGGNPYSYPTGFDTNDGQDLWEELVSQHDQFEIVLSGHVGGDGVAYLAEPGSDGQQVHQMLFNTQFESNGGNGWLRVFEFLDDGKTVRVRTYSPFHDLEKTDAANSFTFEITPIVPILPGDFNDNGLVDAADYTVWRDSLGLPAGTLPNDATGEFIGDAQYELWRANFGAARPAASAVATALPEPATSVGLFLLSIALAFHRSRRLVEQGLGLADR